MDVTTYPITFTGFDADGKREYHFTHYYDAYHFLQMYRGQIYISEFGFTVII